MTGQIATGYLVGNGAAIDVELGWYPDFVWVVNLTDGDLITTAYLGKLAVPFSSGGTATIAAGNILIGATSGSKATVINVLISSGSFAGGDAAGFFVVADQSGTFASENVYVQDNDTGSVDDATITAAVAPSVAIAAAAASATTTSALSRYVGDTTTSKGFTIGSAVAEEAKLLFYVAARGDQYASA